MALLLALITVAVDLFNSFNEIKCNDLIPADFVGTRWDAICEEERVSLEPHAC